MGAAKRVADVPISAVSLEQVVSVHLKHPAEKRLLSLEDSFERSLCRRRLDS